MDQSNSAHYYPVSLDLRNRPCIVIGGGNVAVRKVLRLIACGAQVTVVGHRLSDDMTALVADRSIRHIDADYHRSQIEGAFLVIGATDRDEVNGLISRDARDLHVLVNIVDDPKRCDFILPSILSRGSLSIAVSTGGESPALAKKIRRELEGRFGPEYAELLIIMGRLRESILEDNRPSDANKVFFEAVIQSDILDAVRAKDVTRIHKIIKDKTGKDIPLDITWT
jgi:precorrin-2 dehydrogenase / sirohydrochlorin ferrochelatase